MVPTAARIVAAVAGGLLILATAKSLIGTIVVPRRVRSWVPVGVDRAVDGVFHLVGDRIRSDERRDRWLAAQAATTLLAQLVAWLAAFLLGYALLLWPFSNGGFGAAVREATTSMWTLGYATPGRVSSVTIDALASFTALVTVALQIGYLPTLYTNFSSRETEVTLLYSRAGLPAWGPELLARTHYGFTSGVSTVATLPDLYATWERWAAGVAESHGTYPPLIRFRSPAPLASWVTALLAVLDAAALHLSLCPLSAPSVPARLCLRMGFTCFTEIARTLGASVPDEPDPEAGISLTKADFLDAVARLRMVEFPIERDPEEAWPHFVGWRVNYERAAYAVTAAIDAPPALWSGPRRHPEEPIAPFRPAGRQPPAVSRRAAPP